LTWITEDNVLDTAGHPSYTDCGFTSQAAMDAHITEVLIPAVQSLIEEHLKRTYTDANVPAAVEQIAMRLAAKGLQFIIVNKMGPLIRVADYRVQLARDDIMSPEIRAELEPFVLRSAKVKSTTYRTENLKQDWDE
jgi:hypothetical protein